MQLITASATLFALIPAILAHGNITSPPARLPGPAMAQACGTQAVAFVQSDGTAPIEEIPSNGSPNCNLFMCKGAQFADNQANVQQYAAGQVINMRAILPIPHEGPCNVSIVDTATNTVVGQPLIAFDSYADENLAVLPANNTNFNVKMPSAQQLQGKCQVSGECTMQWFWFGTSAVQSYESCVDFVMV